MSQTYQVNYIVNVQAQEAQTAINAFKRALGSLTSATKPLNELQRQTRSLIDTLGALNKGSYTVKVETKQATQKIGKLVRALQMVKGEIQQLNAMGINLAGGNGKKSKAKAPSATPAAASAGAAAGASKAPKSKPTRTATTTSRAMRPRIASQPSNLGYKLLGPTPLPNNGGMAIDMLKGMGIAYGIAGIGNLVSNIVDQAAEYDNTMKTVENILKSHDMGENFSTRFAGMTRTVRNVGMRTKYKVTEVADAAKFLAMSGYDVDAINQAISPIADIALVGDTELGQTADLVTNVMKAYRIEPHNMRRAADIMTNTFTMSNTTLTEIAESYKYAASLLSTGGVAFEDATAAIGILGNAGIKGSQAGTTMRTILANIVNPTKKQQAAWDEIGISRFKKNGERKDLLEIFTELNNANLDVSTFYRLFHKTAASGAVALAKDADEWNKIAVENFISGGLTRRLAEEKQNTLQGLWAQLVSVFTDQGVTAFGGIQGHLRGLMKRAIDWLDPNKNKEAQKTFKEVANALMEFVNVLIQATKWFGWFYDKFGWFIKTWAKFQLMIWPVVKAVTAFRSVMLSLLGLRKVGVVLGVIASGFGKLGKAQAAAMTASGFMAGPAVATGAAGAQGAKVLPFMGAGIPGLAPLSRSQNYALARQAITQGHGYLGWGRTHRANVAQAFNRKVAFGQIGRSAMNMGKMGAGAAGMMLGMNQMTQENASTADMVSGGLFAAAGTAAMVGGPVGWIAAAALAVGGCIASLVSWRQKVDELGKWCQAFTESHQLIDGALVGNSTRTERYLEFVWRKNYDINDLIQRRIELMKELMGIETPEATTTKDVGNETYKTFYDRFYAADSMWGSNSAAEKAAEIFNKYGKEYGLKIYKENGDWTYKGVDGKKYTFANPDGTTDTNDAVMYDVAAAMEMLHGQYRSKIIDENQKRLANLLYGKGTAADAQKWRDTFAAEYGPASWGKLTRPDQWNEDSDVAKYWNGEDIAQSYMASQLLWESMYQMVEAQKAIAQFLTNKEAGNLTEADVVKALRWGDYDILGQTLATYNPQDIHGWFQTMGYNSATGIWADPSGRETGIVMAQTASGQMERLLESIQKLGLESDPATEALQTYANTLLTLANSFIGENEAISGSFDGEIKELNGQKWKWNATTKQWELLDAGDMPAQLSQQLVDMSNNCVLLKDALTDANQNWPTVWETPLRSLTGSGTYYGADFLSPYWATAPSDATNPQQVGGIVQNPLTFYRPSSQTWGYSWSPLNTYQNGGYWGTSVYPKKQTTAPVTMSAQQFGNAQSVANAKKGGGTGTGVRGTKSSDYKSSQKERAIPKQININIQNLMNVDKLDMSNPETKSLVMNQLKQEIAYALYEAAADGTMMLNGLPNG